MPDAHEPDVRRILAAAGQLDNAAYELDRDADLFDAGLTSLGAMAVVVSLEETLGIQFAAEDLFLDALGSVRGICQLVNDTLAAPVSSPGAQRST